MIHQFLWHITEKLGKVLGCSGDKGKRDQGDSPGVPGDLFQMPLPATRGNDRSSRTQWSVSAPSLSSEAFKSGFG